MNKNKYESTKSNFHCTRDITPKCVTSSGRHLHSLLPEQHNFKETSQRWQAVGNTASDLTGQGIEHTSPSPTTLCLTTDLTGRLRKWKSSAYWINLLNKEEKSVKSDTVTESRKPHLRCDISSKLSCPATNMCV